ncbi:NlpC/P60 family protein [Cyanobacterium sp. IPPAS B-1200]|uniref:C40 family peptidase n=1 Tax=Cyanobacterium sp. IPPAS B-1200 TaxID=1562720 RepID=UPI00085262F5|nr:C40 family peptidase [Cyanobacterium sp. IPPAS B-1200]OEJ79495.1 glycoside hydrolase [Cyanobacterium sp. IPPAS B-1200]
MFLPPSNTGEYVCLQDINLFVNSNCQELSTQGAKGRYIKLVSDTPESEAVKVCLCEDNYQGWLPLSSLKYLQPAKENYQKKTVFREYITQKIPVIIDFCLQAHQVPNYYLWGGTVAPNYDCSGLMQSAFASEGIWLPRDSYQQEDFCQKITREKLEKGDLIFFGVKKVTHVALYLGDNRYIHSSGKDMGNNGIGINELSNDVDQVSRNYYQELWSYGRVIQSL